MNLYILKCKNNKYYVGTTKQDVKKRLTQHMKGSGAAWTKKHKPLWVEKEIENCDVYDEDKWTKIYMDKHGIENVRGGSYSQIELSRSTIKILEREVNHANNKCLNCGKNDHYIKQCPIKPINKKYRAQNIYYLNASYGYETEEERETEEELDEKDWKCSYCPKSFDTKKGAQYHENIHCKKRKQMKKGILSSSDEELDEGVYNVDGEHLYWDGEEWYEESDNYVGHRDGTIGIGSPNMNGWDGEWRPVNKSKNSKCKKCGRNGHYSSKCYAKKHVKGYYLNN